MVLLLPGAVRQNRPQAELLILVPRCRVLSLGLLLVIRYGVRLRPARQNIRLSRLVNGYLLIRVALRIRVSLDLQRVCILSCKQTLSLYERSQASHLPAVAPIPQASVFQHIQARRPLRALQLHVVHVKVRPGSLVVHPYGTRSAALRRKRHAQPHPALVYPCAGLVIDAFTLLLRSRDSQSRHLQVHPFSAE